MKRLLLSLFLVLASVGMATVAFDAEAKRFGGGGNSGLSRQMPARPAAPAVPAKPAQNAQQGAPGAATAPAAAPRRNWLGPVAGLAAGLGIAALASHLGFGAGLANFMTMLLVAMLAFVAIRFLMRKLRPAAPMQFAGAGAGAGGTGGTAPGWSSTPAGGAAAASPFAASSAPGLPPGFDLQAFQKAARLIFIRMQAANDAGDLNDLRAFTTPEMFAAARLDLQDRHGAPQHTDVIQVDAQIVDFAREPGRDVVSVRYSGWLREDLNAEPVAFDEIWHLVRQPDARDWAIAGIQQG